MTRLSDTSRAALRTQGFWRSSESTIRVCNIARDKQPGPPGLLYELCSLLVDEGGGGANFYLVDGRRRHEVGSFSCAIGVVVKSKSEESLRQLKEVIRGRLTKAGWIIHEIEVGLFG